METGNQQLTVEGPAPAATGATYPVLMLRWWLVNARQEARAGVKSIRPQDTDDDRRLAAFIAAGAMALLLVIGCVIAEFSAASSVAIIALGFFGTLFAGLALLLWPEDDEVAQERATVASLLPDAKRVWDEQRAAAKAARAARRAQNPGGTWRGWLTERKSRLVTAVATRRQQWREARAACAEAAAEADLVPLVPADYGPPSHWIPGDGTFPLPVVSEIHLPRILQSVFGGLPAAGENQVVPAALRVEGSEDRAAVSVLVGGRVVGHLSQYDARAFRSKIADDPNAAEYSCRAVIHGEADLGRVRHGLRLDVSL